MFLLEVRGTDWYQNNFCSIFVQVQPYFHGTRELFKYPLHYGVFEASIIELFGSKLSKEMKCKEISLEMAIDCSYKCLVSHRKLVTELY